MIAGGWKDNTCWEPTSQVLYAKDTSNPHSGGASQRIQLIANLVQFIQDVPISMQGGTLYTGTFWLRADRDPMTVTLKFMKQDSPYTIYGSKDVRLNTTWQPYTVTGLGEGYLSVLMLSTTTRGTFWVDDANLVSAPFTIQPPTATITRTFFGMHFHSSTIPLTAAHKPIGAIRLWNIDGPGTAIAQWSGIHISGGITVSGVYSPGVFKWDGLDAHVNRALAHQADLIMNLGRMPKWASANPSAAMNCNGDTYSTGPLKDIRDWRNWVAAAGNRYKGKIRYWEIWNEPDVSDNNVKCNWSGSAKDLAILTKEAYAILKKIDPNNQIISPSPGILGPLSITEPNYLDSYLKELKALNGTVDIIGYHTYIAEAPESQTWKYIPDLRSIAQKYGFANTPLWNTESGWLMADVSASQAAAYVSRAHILDWAMGIKRHYFYAWDEVNKLGIELVDDAGTFQHLTAAGNAYTQTAQWLNGATMTSVKIATNNTWVVELRRGTSNYGYIVWNPTVWETAKPISFTLPASVQWKHELSGIVSAVSGGTVVAIDDKPVLFDSSAQLAGFTLTDSEEPIVSENPDTAAESTHTLYLPIISQEVE